MCCDLVIVENRYQSVNEINLRYPMVVMSFRYDGIVFVVV